MIFLLRLPSPHFDIFCQYCKFILTFAFPPFRREKRAGTAALRVLRQKGRKIEETEMCYRFTASVRRGNNIFCKNIRDRVAFKKKYDYNKLFSMFGTTI